MQQKSRANRESRTQKNLALQRIEATPPMKSNNSPYEQQRLKTSFSPYKKGKNKTSFGKTIQRKNLGGGEKTHKPNLKTKLLS